MFFFMCFFENVSYVSDVSPRCPHKNSHKNGRILRRVDVPAECESWSRGEERGEVRTAYPAGSRVVIAC